MSLSSYISETRNLLHDSNGKYWTDPELADYINDGRNRVALETKCLRSLQLQTLTLGIETFPVASLPQGGVTIDVLNITYQWGASRIPLRYLPFTQFNAYVRAWSNQRGRPLAWSLYGQSPGIAYIGPIPDQDYASEWDTAIIPAALVTDMSDDPIAYPFTSPVAFYAAYKAKHKEQSYAEAQVFFDGYKTRINEAIQGSFTRRLRDVYA